MCGRRVRQPGAGCQREAQRLRDAHKRQKEAESSELGTLQLIGLPSTHPPTGQDRFLEHRRVGDRGIERGHAPDRRVEVVEQSWPIRAAISAPNPQVSCPRARRSRGPCA